MVTAGGEKTGQDVVIGGLFVQIAFFGFFTITAIVFQSLLAKKPTLRSIELSSIWHRHMQALYITSVLILVRSVVRVIEYIEGFQGYIMTHEAFIYVFDALLMLVAMVALQWWHPSEVTCLLGHGHKYSEKMILMREFVPESAPVETLERESDEE